MPCWESSSYQSSGASAQPLLLAYRYKRSGTQASRKRISGATPRGVGGQIPRKRFKPGAHGRVLKADLFLSFQDGCYHRCLDLPSPDSDGCTA